MRRFATLAALFAACAFFTPAISVAQSSPSDSGAPARKSAVQPEQSVTHGTVTVEGKQISYRAVAGTIILKNDEDKPTGSMFYVAYFKQGADPATRPVTFLYNGGPGSSTVWLHMGAFGPRRVTTADHSHTAAAPYKLVNNDYSLLDASDLVFVDAMGTGFSRIIGKDRGGDRHGQGLLRGGSPTPTRSRTSSPASCRSTGAGTRPSTCSARATARPARPCSRTTSRTGRTST